MHKIFRKIHFFIIILFFVIISIRPSLCANFTDTPGGQAGILDQKEKEKEISKRAKKTVEPEKPVILPFGVKEGGPAFLVKKITVKGDQEIAFEKILDIVLKYEGKQMTVAELYKIADAISKAYEANGYVTSYAYIPEQDVTSGNVQINVVEGKVGRIKVQGNKYFKDKLLTRDLENRLVGKILDYDVLEKIVRQLNFNTDRQVKVYLMPGKNEKETDILLMVDDTRPGHISVDVDNTGTEATGRERYGISFSHSNFLGIDDEWVVKQTIGTNISGTSTSWTVPLGDQRTKIGISYQDVTVKIKGDIADLKAKGYSRSGQLFLLREFYTSKDFDIDARLGMTYKRVWSEALGTPMGIDDLMSVNMDLFMDFRDQWGRSFINPGIDIGIPNFLGSSPKDDLGMSRINAESDFIKLRGGYDRYQKLFNNILHLKSRLQFSKDNLPPAEQFPLGGMNTVRGYSEGEYGADTSATATAELFIPIPFAPKFKMPFTHKPFNEAVQLVGFYDWGYGKINNPRNAEEQDIIFKSIGFGLRANLFEKMYGRVEWGFAQGDDSMAGDSEFHFSIQTELL